MSQATLVLPTTGPLTMAAWAALANAAFAAGQTQFSGGTAPSTTGYPATYQFWMDTSFAPARMKVYDASTWPIVGYLDAVNHQWAPALFPIQPPSTVALTLALVHVGKQIELNVGTTNTLTIPPSSVVAFPANTRIKIAQTGAGITTIAASTLGTVTLNSYGGKFKMAGQYAVAELYRTSTDAWILSGPNLTT